MIEEGNVSVYLPAPTLTPIVHALHVQIPGAMASFVKGVATEISWATKAKSTLHEQRHLLANIITCADITPDGVFV